MNAHQVLNKTPKHTRTGSSLAFSPADCPASVMVQLGLSVEVAERIIRARRVLPFVEDRKQPVIDLRKLWERIGKPEGRFNMWVTRSAEKVLHRFVQKSEVQEFLVPTKGRPKQGYLVSRDCASHLCMMADTKEGEMIRDYFCDCEDLLIALAARNPVRASALTDLDRNIAHIAYKGCGRLAAEGRMARHRIKSTVVKSEAKAKAALCLMLSGVSTEEWLERFGKRIRDVLDVQDLRQYEKAYESLCAMLEGGMMLVKAVEVLTPTYGSTINPAKYMH